MPGPCSGKKLILVLVTDYIQKRRGKALLLSFEYTCTANVNRQTTDKLLFSYAIITGENV